MFKRIAISFVLVLVLAFVGCSSPYVRAQKEYYNGNPGEAETIILPESNKMVAENKICKNLYLWDLGVYRFSQSNFDGALESFMQSVKGVEEIHSAGKTVKATLTNASSQEYVGDPVEISVAYLYIGLCYYMKGDYQNALVGFRRSIEEDLSKEEIRHGDMSITNYLIGECYLKTGRYNEAIVAFRRAVEFNENLVPAWAGLYETILNHGDNSQVPVIREKYFGLTEKCYRENVQNNFNQGLTVLVFSGHPSLVKGDAWLGCFRNRKEIKEKAKVYEVTFKPTNHTYKTYLSDRIHNHFKDQGGMKKEAKHQATRAIIGKGMKAIFGFGGPSTDADIRFWPTMPGYFFIAYIPIEKGTYSLELNALDSDGDKLQKYFHMWDNINVKEGKRTLVVMTSYGTITTSPN